MRVLQLPNRTIEHALRRMHVAGEDVRSTEAGSEIERGCSFGNGIVVAPVEVLVHRHLELRDGRQRGSGATSVR